MILTETIQVKVAQRKRDYWKSLGYQIKGKNCEITAKVEHLEAGSNVRVRCKCDECGKEYIQRFCRDTRICYPCRNSMLLKGNKNGSGNKGKSILKMRGALHPRWNPNKKAFQEYSGKVRWLSEKTYRENIDVINPLRLPRTVCGADGGYQLDHIISIKKCFQLGIVPEEAAKLENLQLLTWRDNRVKSA